MRLGFVVKPFTIFFLLNFFIVSSSAMSQNIFVVNLILKFNFLTINKL